VLFGLEQVLGHVSLAQSIKRFAPDHARYDSTFADVTFHEAGGRIERLPVPGYLRGALRARMQVRRGLSAGLPDAFVFNTQKPALMCPDYVRARPSMISLDVTPVQYDCMAEAYDHTPDKPGLARNLKHAWNRQLFRSARRLLPWSTWAARSLRDDYGVPDETICVVPPGADTERWSPAPRETEGPVRILFVGGNFERKGGMLLLDWFRHAADASRCQLCIVTRDDVPATPGVEVHRAGNNSDALIELARSCDIFALPTEADCFSIASIEAMAVGLPVVTTNVGGIGDIVAHGESGYLIEPGDPDGLAAALGALTGDPALRRRMGAGGRDRAERMFDAKTNVGRVFDVIDGVLAEEAERRGKRTRVRVAAGALDESLTGDERPLNDANLGCQTQDAVLRRKGQRT
jgi:glycosyltransferase involved in cell wall biosynthesis